LINDTSKFISPYFYSVIFYFLFPFLFFLPPPFLFFLAFLFLSTGSHRRSFVIQHTLPVVHQSGGVAHGCWDGTTGAKVARAGRGGSGCGAAHGSRDGVARVEVKRWSGVAVPLDGEISSCRWSCSTSRRATARPSSDLSFVVCFVVRPSRKSSLRPITAPSRAAIMARSKSSRSCNGGGIGVSFSEVDGEREHSFPPLRASRACCTNRQIAYRAPTLNMEDDCSTRSVPDGFTVSLRKNFTLILQI
jgi:hypothetical protein